MKMLCCKPVIPTIPCCATLTCSTHDSMSLIQHVLETSDNHGHGRVPNVTRNQTPEPFLPSCIPELQPHGAILKIHGLGEEINPNGCLTNQNRTKKTSININCQKAYHTTHSSFLHTTQNLQMAHNTMNVTKTEESTPTEEKLERQTLTW
ncbi:hypothetical protein KC19_VG098000 [Ceratodon purpureus]|uniref:Uncharacterized protein n=1 Tax=Ceratodon purpureus TaxID=3225 RepID=A0A8T0HPE3_CERPU|nr:hypothetical protein KC19_VG098000 [Ceratodon purpureus]